MLFYKTEEFDRRLVAKAIEKEYIHRVIIHVNQRSCKEELIENDRKERDKNYSARGRISCFTRNKLFFSSFYTWEYYSEPIFSARSYVEQLQPTWKDCGLWFAFTITQGLPIKAEKMVCWKMFGAAAYSNGEDCPTTYAPST